MIANVLLIGAVFRSTKVERTISRSIWKRTSSRLRKSLFPSQLALDQDQVRAGAERAPHAPATPAMNENSLRQATRTSFAVAREEGDVELRDVPSFLLQTERTTHLTTTPSFTNFTNPMSDASAMEDAHAAASGEIGLVEVEDIEAPTSGPRHGAEASGLG